MSIKVLHIINSLGLGGAQVCLKGITENTNADQVNCLIYPLRPLEEIKINSTVIDHHRVNYSPLKLWDIIKLCKKHNIDIIHAHLNKAAIIAILASFFCNAKVIVHEHGQITENSFQFALYRFFLKLFSFRVNAFIAVSSCINNAVTSKCKIRKDKVNTIYNAVDLDKFKFNLSSRQRIRSELGLIDSDTVLGFTGRLHQIKGADLLPEALSVLHKQGCCCHLVIAGHGCLIQPLKDQTASLGLSDYVHFLGLRNDIPDLISAFDIAVQPSRLEAFGISIIEYYAAEIPVICSHTQGLAEITQDNITALVLDTISPDEISKRVIELTSNNKLKSELTQNALKYCRKFSTEDQINKINSLYRQILQK